MASKNVSNSKTRSDTKNIKIKDSSEMSAVIALSRAAQNSALMEDQDSLYYDKGLQLSDEHLDKVKNETDALNKIDILLDNKSSPLSIKMLKTTKTLASATASTTAVKKEISNEEESLSKVPANTSAPMKPIKAMDVQSGEVNSNNATGGSLESSDECKKECNNVIRLAAKTSDKNLSDEERKLLRAKRFNIIVVESCQNAKTLIANQVSTPVGKSASISANRPTPTYDLLKKRAERFGENVSTVMKSLDYKEKMLKRKLKFLESVTNLKELEIKKTRAERFRMV